MGVLQGCLWVTRRASLSETDPRTQTRARRPDHKGAGAPARASRPTWNHGTLRPVARGPPRARPPRARRVTRTEACVTYQLDQPAGRQSSHRPDSPPRPAGQCGRCGAPGSGPYRSGRDQELLHHRPHRSRQVDAGGPDAAAHRGGGGAPDARAVPGPDGHRARARHHDQVPGRPAALGKRRPGVRAQPHRHPGPRRLQLRGLPQPGRLRGRGAAGRRGPGHRGADAGQPVPGPGRRPEDHPGAEQDRPAGRAARPVRGRTRRDHRLRSRRGAAGERQDRRRRRGAAARDRPPRPGPGRRSRTPRPGP